VNVGDTSFFFEQQQLANSFETRITNHTAVAKRRRRKRGGREEEFRETLKIIYCTSTGQREKESSSSNVENP